MSTIEPFPPLCGAVLVVLLIAVSLAAMVVWPHISAKQNMQRADEVRGEAEIATRADREHHLWMSGDPRGFYGQFPPADL